MPVTIAELQAHVGQSIDDVCDKGFASASQNHCAHFVSHALGLKIGMLCGDMAYKTRHSGASIRCDELYNGLASRGPWAERRRALPWSRPVSRVAASPFFLALLVVGTVHVDSPAASAESANPARTRLVLSALLAASNERIPAISSCAGNYGQDGSARIGDLPSMQLAYINRGESRIVGECLDSQCTLTINRSFEEDVSSMTIRFNVSQRKLLTQSLACMSTP